MGDTMVLVTACHVGHPRGVDFLPLTVDYREYAYASGRFPGGFFKREGKATEKEVLTSRVIDRPIRPLFPAGWRNETQIIAFVISSDGQHDADILAINGASAALTISDIPFQGPIGAVRIGLPGTASLPPFCDWPADLASLVNGGIWQVEGGHDYDGRSFMSLDTAALRKAGKEIRAKGLRSVAITAMFSPLDATHEDEAAAMQEVVSLFERRFDEDA